MNIGGELRRPELYSRFGHASAARARVPVPEASVHEYNGSIPREHNVRTTGPVSPMQAKAASHRVEQAANGQLWLAPAALDRRGIATHGQSKTR